MDSRKKTTETLGDYTMRASLRNTAPGNLRVGQQVRGSGGGSFDEDVAPAAPKSVAILVTNRRGDVLAVSRPDDVTDMNMPGGGIEQGETPEDAARRELWEETGIVSSDLVEVHRQDDLVVFMSMSHSGRVRSSEEGVAEWVPEDVVRRGRYGSTFSRVIQKLSL